MTKAVVVVPATKPPKADFEMLHDMLRTMRPEGSVTEDRFVAKWIKPFGAKPDKFGNMVLRIGTDPIMWSSHLDTVHNHGGLQPILVDEDKGLIKLHPKALSNCLGADDTAGVWLMVQMARAKRPGLYIWHRGEEIGGKGSAWIAANTPDLLTGIEYAIAFDRKGKDSIITHQWGGRCCSETFSQSLALELGMGMKSDSGGSFTDTANYTALVGECTNLSVGYTGQHGKCEDLDQNFLAWLLERLLVLDVNKLVAVRKPGEKEAKWSNWGRGNHGATTFGGSTKKARRHSFKSDDKTFYRWRGRGLEIDTVEALVEDYPEEIAAMLKGANYSVEFLRSAIEKHGGVIDDPTDAWGCG